MNPSALLTPGGVVEVTGYGSLGLDFGSECGGWLELGFESPDLASPAAAAVLLSTSEFRVPQFTTGTGPSNNGGNCTKAVVALGGGRFQLQLNSELYEGLRYGWIHVVPAPPPGYADPASLHLVMSPRWWHPRAHLNPGLETHSDRYRTDIGDDCSCCEIVR